MGNKKKENNENLWRYPPAIYSLPNGPEKCLPTLSYPKISFPNMSCTKISKATKREKKLQDMKKNLKFILLFSTKKRIIKYKIKNLKNAIDFSVAFETNDTIDSINILKATHSAMHKAIKGLNVKPDFLLVDGNRFEPYFDEYGDVIEHECFIKGDDKFQSISAASILAKVYHDEYIENLVEKEPELKVYGWEKNMCYGTKTHLDAIKEHGISKYHRKTFGICREYVN